MCLAIPGKVLKISGKSAEIDFAGEIRKSSAEFVDVRVGDYVLAYGKHIIERISKSEALNILKELGL
jgi:hydrogenase expression/formation protein HypC